MVTVLLWILRSNVPCCPRHCNHHDSSSPIRDDAAFQSTFRIPPIRHDRRHPAGAATPPDADRHSPCWLPAGPPTAWTSSHHWYRHRHRASNERRAMRRVKDWLNQCDHDAAVPPSSELDRGRLPQPHTLVVHEHRCRQYSLR